MRPYKHLFGQPPDLDPSLPTRQVESHYSETDYSPYVSESSLQPKHFPQISYEVDEPLNEAPSEENVECDYGKAFLLGNCEFCSLACPGISPAMASEAIESPNVRNVQNPDVCTGKLTPGHSLCRNERALSFSGHDKDLLSKPEQLSTKSFSKRRPSGPTDWLVTLISPKPRTTDTNQSTAKRLGVSFL